MNARFTACEPTSSPMFCGKNGFRTAHPSHSDAVAAEAQQERDETKGRLRGEAWRDEQRREGRTLPQELFDRLLAVRELLRLVAASGVRRALAARQTLEQLNKDHSRVVLNAAASVLQEAGDTDTSRDGASAPSPASVSSVTEGKPAGAPHPQPKDESQPSRSRQGPGARLRRRSQRLDRFPKTAPPLADYPLLPSRLHGLAFCEPCSC